MSAFRSLAKTALSQPFKAAFEPGLQTASQASRSTTPRFASSITRNLSYRPNTHNTGFAINKARQALPKRWHMRPHPARSIRHNSSSPRPNPTQHLNSPPANLSLKDQLKRLTKEYGRGAVLVYLLFSVADLPVAFGIVQLFGPERVGAAEHAVLGYIKSAWHSVVDPILGHSADGQTVPARDDVETATVREGIIGNEAVHIAAKAKDGGASKFIQVSLNPHLY